MRVHIEGDLYLSGDERGYSIEKKNVTQSGDNAGKEIFSPIGHYVQLASCVNALLKVKLANTTAVTLSELLAEIKKHRAFIETTLIPKVNSQKRS